MWGRIFGVVLAASLVVAPSSAQERALEWSGQLDEGQELVVRGISGDVTARLGTGSRAEVVATKRGRSSDFDRVEVQVFEENDAVIVCANYRPHLDADCRDGLGSSDRDDRDDEDHSRNLNVSIDFEVLVPAGVEFRASTVAGDVKVEGLRSDVDASTVSGDVSVATSGVARGRTVSGSVEVEMESLDWDELDFTTVSGDITVTVPNGLDADVDFSSLSGDFRSDFEVEGEQRRRRFIGSRVEGRIGDGGRALTFKTVSGDVRLRSLRR